MNIKWLFIMLIYTSPIIFCNCHLIFIVVSGMLWINIFNSLFLLFWLEEFHSRTFPTVTFVKSLKIKKCRKVLIIAKNALSKQGIIEFLKNGEILKISRNIWIKYRKVRKFFDANTNLEIGKNSYLWKICKFRKHSEISEK